MAPGCSLPSLPAGPTTTQHGHADPNSRGLVPASATINSHRQMATFPFPRHPPPCLSLAFCQRSASSYYHIDAMYFAQMLHSKRHQLMTGFEVPRLILYKCCVFLFCHAAENGVTNKTSQRLKEKAKSYFIPGFILSVHSAFRVKAA